MPTLMGITELLEPIGRTGPQTLPHAADWMQGRTFYGGASALIAYTAARRAHPDLPPLRAAQIGFIAPVGEAVETRVEIVRQGRNVTQVRSEIWCDGAPALTGFWLFGAAREANALHPASRLKDADPPAPDAEPMMPGKGPPFIRNHFELHRAQDERGKGDPRVRRWLRLTSEHDLDPIAELILVGDTLPPGAMRAMQRQGPLSSINWSFNLLGEAPVTRGGWWLSETHSQWADDGFSSERLRLWNADGEQVMDGFQIAAIFG